MTADTKGHGAASGSGRWEIAPQAADLLVAEKFEEVDGLFNWEEVRNPSMVWNPDIHTLPHPTVVDFYETWAAMPRMDGELHPRAKDFDIFTFEQSMGFMMYLDVLEGGDEFRYRVYGSRVAHHTGFDLTGRNLSECHMPTVAREFIAACYMAVVRRREPLFTVHTSPKNFLDASWNRVIVPMLGDDGEVSRLLGVNVPTADRNLEDGIRSVFR